jgi:hypothetical protein
MNFVIFWDVVLCSLIEAARRFRGTYCPYNQTNEEATHVETGEDIRAGRNLAGPMYTGGGGGEVTKDRARKPVGGVGCPNPFPSSIVLPSFDIVLHAPISSPVFLAQLNHSDDGDNRHL